MRNLLLFIILLASSFSWSQNSGDSIKSNTPIDTANMGYVRFLVDVDNGYFEIVIDDTMYLKKYKCKLPVGHHKAKIWSPGYVIREVDFDIEKNQTVDKYVPMVISNGRQEYERDYKAYRMKFHKSFTLPFSISLGLAITSGSFMVSAYTMRQQIFSDIDLYFKAPSYSEATFYKNSIEQNNQKYNRRRVLFYTTLGLTVASVATTCITFAKFNRNNEEPTLDATSPFKDKFSMSISPFGCAIKWKFG